MQAETLELSPKELYEKLRHIQLDNPVCFYTLEKCERMVPTINRILRLKKEKNALILAHTYVHPDIIYGVSDHVGDSFGLAEKARDTDADIIVFPSVKFMAETAKILNPGKTVIDPNPNGGCTLADSITDEDVLRLREKYPHHTFVCYINTTASIKALCDVCVTSSNVYTILSNLPSDKIYFLPDRLMGENIKNELKKRNIDKEVLYYHGSCYVHEEFDEGNVFALQKQYPNLQIIAHPECKPEVIQHAHKVSSTTGIIDYVKQIKDKSSPFLLLTECGVASRLLVEDENLKIVGACSMCRYMRSNSLQWILQSLENPKPTQVIEIETDILANAKKCLDAMFFYASNSICNKKNPTC